MNNAIRNPSTPECDVPVARNGFATTAGRTRVANGCAKNAGSRNELVQPQPMNEESKHTDRLVVPAEASEVAKFPMGTKIHGKIGAVSGEQRIAGFAADDQSEALLIGGIGLTDDVSIGDEGFAIMKIDEQTEISYWRFEKDEDKK